FQPPPIFIGVAMFLDYDRCVQCGTYLSMERRWWRSEYPAFAVPICSNACYKATVSPLIKKFLEDDTEEDKEELKKDEARLKESLAHREWLYKTYNKEYQDYELPENQD